MEQYISKSALVAELERLFEKADNSLGEYRNGAEHTLISINDFLDTLEVKEVDIDKMLCFRRNIGFAYPEGASEYQIHLACYRQGIEDVLKAQKGEKYVK